MRSTHRLFRFRGKPEHDKRASEGKPPAGNGHRTEARQPFSDGSEEFFEEFTRRDEGLRIREQRGFLLGLGLAVGLFLALGALMFFRRSKTDLS